MKIDETNERQLSTLAAWLEEATLKASAEAYDRGYAEATADAMKVLRREDPIAVGMVPLSDALRGRENLHHRLGRAEGHEEGYQKGLRAAQEAAAGEVERAWSWWLGATVEGRKSFDSGPTIQSKVAYYLAQATNWAINYNTGEVDNPLARATVLQEGRKTGHEAAVEFAKQVIAGTLRDDSYGIKEAVDTRVRLAEIKARDEARAYALDSAGAMAQAALKTGGFARFENEATELADALDGFLERERDYRRRSSRDVATQECWDAFAKLTEQVAAGEPFDRPNKPNVISVPSAARRRVEVALTKLQARWSRAASLVNSYIHDGGLKPTTDGEMQFVALLRELRRNSYLDGFDCARKKAIREAHDLKAPNVVDIPDPVSDVPF